MPSIAKIHGILELLRQNYKQGLSNKEISEQLDIPISTCYRILASLKKFGYVQQRKNSPNYFLGVVHLRFAQALMEGLDENAVIDPYLEELHQVTGLTTVLSRYSGENCVAMEVRGAVNTRISVGIGEIMPFHCSSAGKIILSFLPEVEKNKIITNLKFEPRTPDTIRGEAALRECLEEFYQTGTSTNLGELHQGINSMATPLFDRTNKVFAALAMVGTSYQMDEEFIRKSALLFHDAGRKITEKLGGRYPDWLPGSEE